MYSKVTQIYISFPDSLPLQLLQDTKYSSLCPTVGPSCLSFHFCLLPYVNAQIQLSAGLFLCTETVFLSLPLAQLCLPCLFSLTKFTQVYMCMYYKEMYKVTDPIKFLK